MITSATFFFLCPDAPQLERVEVRRTDGQQLVVSRGALPGVSNGFTASNFSWSKAVQGLSILFLRTLLHRTDTSISPSLQGGQGSLAASLDYAISKETQWLCDMFGVDTNGRATVRRLVGRRNPERKRPGPVTLAFGATIVREARLAVELDGQKLDTPGMIQLLRALDSHVDPGRPLDVSRNLDPTNKMGVSLHREADTIPITFLCPSDGANPFYGEVLRTVSQMFPGRLTPILPRENFDPHHVWQHIERYIRVENEQMGVILIPDDPDMHRDTILQVHSKRNLSLVLFDVDIQRMTQEEDLPPFVGGDEDLGGHLAAELAAAYLGQEAIRNPNILVVRGATTEWESRRSSGFSRSLRALIPGASITETPKLLYDRVTSRRFLVDHIAFSKLPGAHYDLIFACNDDMALGCRGALVELQRLGRIDRISTKIIGYDGIREMQELIQFGDDIVLGTIDVQLDTQLDLLQRVLLEHISNPKSASSRHLVKPRLISNLYRRLQSVGT